MSQPMTLGDRMKSYEHRTRTVLPARCWTICRVDGRAFHSYTHGLERPFDATFAADMDAVAVALASQMSGAITAYVQSDEISVLLSDFATATTQPWFGGVSAKITSLSASIATATLIGRRPPTITGKTPLFDSRVFTVPDRAEVINYFLWRQRDAIKNSISMSAQACFSHAQLQGLHAGELLAKLRDDAAIDWRQYPTGFRHGRIIRRVQEQGTVSYFHKKLNTTLTETVTRNKWIAEPAPEFTHDPAGLLSQLLPEDPAPSHA